MKQAPRAVPKQKAPLYGFLWGTFQRLLPGWLPQASPQNVGLGLENTGFSADRVPGRQSLHLRPLLQSSTHTTLGIRQGNERVG